MDIFSIIGLLGGLAMFLFGMKYMGEKLEKLAGGRLEKMFEKLTSNRFLGLALGAFVTAVVQSSSATTVMLVGFVNSGLMRLAQTIPVIMGANIGTTITTWLLSLVGIEGDSIFIKLLKPTSFSPIIALIGVILIMCAKSGKKRDIGGILIGFAILMFGMTTMGDAVEPLSTNEQFAEIFVMFSNPFFGVLAGAILTAIIQSSAASIGMLQMLSLKGMVTFGSALPIILGQNIGTCITAILSSIGANKNAKRVAVVHLVFNVIGTVVFVAICRFFPFVSLVEKMFPSSVSVQIANAHVIFKIVTTILLYPFAGWLVKTAHIVIKDKDVGTQRLPIYERAKTMAGYSVGNSAIAISLIREETNYMYDIARKNLALSFEALKNRTDEKYEEIHENEREIDRLNREISRYISTVITNKMPAHDSEIVSGYFGIIGNIERIGDHAMNFADYVKFIINQDIAFSDRAMGEIDLMQAVSQQAMDLLVGDKRDVSRQLLTDVAKAEQKMDDMTDAYRTAQMDRMKTTTCSPEATIAAAPMSAEPCRPPLPPHDRSSHMGWASWYCSSTP